MTPAATHSMFDPRRYADVALAVGIIAILALMVLRLPTPLIDVLVAVNIGCGVALLLVALYVPHPVSFSSFPSVLLISTLFRLSLSVATTRLILLDADAGHIIEAFGKFVAGGNLVVGVVVFVIITIVQFIVIAKGAERVAEVAARFTLDAMPGKQLSIDSDLRSGLIDKDEARRRRSLLERESQLNGALDGAMKFVKGDAIASIIIVIVNLLGGLTIGVLQRDLSAGEAMHVYSNLSIGDGLVAQIPALLSAMAAGLIVTRSAGEGDSGHLGETIGRQMMAHPRALLLTGLISLLLSVVPGFPALVFISIAVIAFVLARHAARMAAAKGGSQRLRTSASNSSAGVPFASAPGSHSADSGLAPPLAIEIAASAVANQNVDTLQDALVQRAAERGSALGIRLPVPVILVTQNSEIAWRIAIFDEPVAMGMAADAKTLTGELDAVLTRHAERFVGVQEVSNLLDAAAEQYPALVKEVLRQAPPQRIAEVLRNLLRENIPVRNLRDVLEALAEWSSRERDTGNLTEFVRMHLKRYITSRFVKSDRQLRALVVDGAAEEAVRRALTETATGVAAMLPPQRIAALRDGLRAELMRLQMTDAAGVVLIASADVRRHLRQIFEPVRPALPVVSYQELLPDVEIQALGTVRLKMEAV